MLHVLNNHSVCTFVYCQFAIWLELKTQANILLSCKKLSKLTIKQLRMLGRSQSSANCLQLWQLTDDQQRVSVEPC